MHKFTIKMSSFAIPKLVQCCQMAGTLVLLVFIDAIKIDNVDNDETFYLPENSIINMVHSAIEALALPTFPIVFQQKMVAFR